MDESEKHGLRQNVDAVILRFVKTLTGYYVSVQEDAKKRNEAFLKAYKEKDKSKELIPKARQTSMKNSFKKARRPSNLQPEMELRKLKYFMNMKLIRITTDIDIWLITLILEYLL